MSENDGSGRSRVGAGEMGAGGIGTCGVSPDVKDRVAVFAFALAVGAALDDKVLAELFSIVARPRAASEVADEDDDSAGAAVCVFVSSCFQAFSLL